MVLLSEVISKHAKAWLTPSTITPAAEPSTVSLPVLSSGRTEPSLMVAGLAGRGGNTPVSKTMVSADDGPGRGGQGGTMLHPVAEFQIAPETCTHSAPVRSSRERSPVASIMASRSVSTAFGFSMSSVLFTVMVTSGLACASGLASSTAPPARAASRSVAVTSNVRLPPK